MKIETTLEYVKEGLEDNKIQHENIINKLDDFITSAPSKFADKRAEARISVLEDKDHKRDILLAKIIGGTIVAWFIIQILLKHYGLV